MRSLHRTGILLLIAAALLAGSAAGSSQAALSYYSENYTAQFEMFDIGVTLLENGKEVSWRNYNQKDDLWDTVSGTLSGTDSEGIAGKLLEHMIDTEHGETLQPGRRYEERLSVRNSGSIDEYVRVMVYRYWTDADGRKLTEVSPEDIDLHLLTDGNWSEDRSASTEERLVLYYGRVLESGAESEPFADSLTIRTDVAQKVTEEVREENGYTVIRTTYAYDGLRFVLEAEVDAVQTHNAADAIRSAWGVDVKIGADGSLSF